MVEKTKRRSKRDVLQYFQRKKVAHYRYLRLEVEEKERSEEVEYWQNTWEALHGSKATR